MNLTHAEEKEKPDIVKKYKPDGFPTYFVECSDKPGKVESFNSIKMDDMLDKIKSSIKSLGGSKEAPVMPPVQPESTCYALRYNQKHLLCLRLNYNHLLNRNILEKPMVSGEIYYKDCNEAYGPISLQSVSYNILNTMKTITSYRQS